MEDLLISVYSAQTIKTRIARAFQTIPSRSDWQWSLTLLLSFGVFVVPLGFKLNFLNLELFDVSLWILVRTALVTLIFPSTVEEVIFRVCFIPHTAERRSSLSTVFSTWGSLVLFVAYHPLNAALFMSNARGTFDTFPFLLFALSLGIVCAAAYVKSGSIYPSIFLHWIIVVAWLLCFGGYGRLHI